MREVKEKKECKHNLKVSSLCQTFIHNSKNIFIDIELTSNKQPGLRKNGCRLEKWHRNRIHEKCPQGQF